MQEEEVIVVGAGGHAKVVIDILNYNSYKVIGIVDENKEIHGTDIMGITVLGGKEVLINHAHRISNAFVAIGNNNIRVKIGEELKQLGYKLITAIHHNASVAESVRLGEGSMVAAGGIINPDAKIGSHVIINTGATVDHDCVIANGAHISPGANLAGNVSVGTNSHIGIGASIIQSINIGDDVVVGAGAVVVKDIESDVTAYGVPAKVKSFNYK